MEFYDSLGIHRVMLTDQARNRTFREGLRAVVRPGSVVLDVGAGTGILSMYAVQAGARRVYAVERTRTARLARRLIKQNGMAASIQVIESDIETAWLPEPCDVIVSEWLGTIGLDEHLLAPVLLARDRWLKPGGMMVPRVVRTWLAPTYSRIIDHQDRSLQIRDDSLDLGLLIEAGGNEFVWQAGPESGDTLLSAPQVAWQVDTLTCPAGRAFLPFRASLHFQTNKAGLMNGVCLWFDATFPSNGYLSSGPMAEATHWGQYLLPLTRPCAVKMGTPVAVTLTYFPIGAGQGAHAWTVQCGTSPAEYHDTRLQAG